MGLGKTAIALSALEDRHLPVLVIAPKRVAESVWEQERDIWRPDLSITVAIGGPKKRKTAIKEKSDITVIGRDVIRNTLIRTPPWNTIILDELSGFKSQGSSRWRAAKSLRNRIAKTRDPIVWGLTGTPAPNGLMDLWSELYLLDGGERLGPRLTHFKERWFEVGTITTRDGRQRPAIGPNGRPFKWDLRPGAGDEIQSRIEDICISMETEGRITLPPITYNNVIVRLPRSARQTYDEMEQNLVADLDVIGDLTFSAANAAVLTNKLSQINAGFLYDDDRLQAKRLHEEKIKALLEILDGTGSPVMVAYQYEEEKTAILEALGDDAHTIDEPDAIDRWNRREIPVLLAHPRSAGHGLNLQHGGFTLVWMSLTWALEEWLQMNKRLFRQGQQHHVIIHRIVVEDTIDEAKILRLDGKLSVHEALMKYLGLPI